MPASYTNFYETLKEAQMRLNHTIVMYDNEPYFVVCLDDHKADGIFRIYLEPINNPSGLTYGGSPYSGSHPGAMMDQYLNEMKDTTRIIRKQLNSPLFNKFRPFPLGMCDSGGFTYYCERAPVRATYQGLNRDMLMSQVVTLDTSNRAKGRNGYGPDMFTADFYNTIMGKYFTPQEALGHLLSGKVKNQSLAFHRHFCFLRGPVDTMFLAYKAEIIGTLPSRDFTQLNLVKKYFYTKEVIDELGVFDKIVIADK